ncbi:antitoxin StbD [Sphingopyxis italica]|uniref:Antitoxin n=1 Tax=Sphingopyxis italica TaxID=1129133 RepID=A0A7X6B8K6_9SPHN|nr:type II toxin-antitoxin system Phd/YefM family antitoxin [Sphingopyxis italica]NJB88847.1 antitoxin StbD [Sphingopyxis italica]
MGKPLLADFGISISELKKNPSAAIRAADGAPVAILNRNTPEAYLVPAEAWEKIMDALDDMVLADIVRSRAGEKGIKVNIDDL